MTETAQPKVQRYLALDAYRGFIMLMLVSHGFGFGALAGDPTFGTIASWFEHKPWEGITFWDLVQPGFMYIVGVLTGGFSFIGTLAPVAESLAVLAAMYALNDWLYGRRIFIKV